MKFINKLHFFYHIFCISICIDSLIFAVTQPPFISQRSSEQEFYVLHNWVEYLDDTDPASAILLKQFSELFLERKDLRDCAGRGVHFYLGGALMKAIQKNKIHLAYVLAEYNTDYNVRGNIDNKENAGTEKLDELNLFHFCALYLPDNIVSVDFINHLIKHADKKKVVALLRDSLRWQRDSVILPIDIAISKKKNKIAGAFNDILKTLECTHRVSIGSDLLKAIDLADFAQVRSEIENANKSFSSKEKEQLLKEANASIARWNLANYWKSFDKIRLLYWARGHITSGKKAVTYFFNQRLVEAEHIKEMIEKLN